MRILHIEDESWDSGIAHYALTLAQELKNRGHEIYFWGLAGSVPCRKAREIGLLTREIKNPWLALPGLRSELKNKKIELINAHTGSAQALAAAAAAGLRIPLVRTRGDARLAASHSLARALAQKTRAYIAANSRIKEQLGDIFPETKVELIFQGITVPPAVPLVEEPIIGILARLDLVKGHEDFMVGASEAIRSLPQTKFLVAGTGPAERIARLTAWAAKLGLKNSLELLGFVDNADSFISRCRIGVVASLDSEAVSRAALEWMAQGRPLIATRVGCLPDIVEHEKSGLLVPAGHPGHIAMAIKQLLKNPEETARMGAYARQRFEERFSIKRFADDTERLYEEVRHLPS